MKSDFSKFPSMDSLLSSLKILEKKIDTIFLKQLLEQIVDSIKSDPKKYKIDQLTRNDLSTLIIKQTRIKVSEILSPSFRRIINATGVILHTGLGRAPLGDDNLNQLKKISGYTNLEIKLSSGKRGERLEHITPLLQLLTGTEDAVVVNNNAAAVLLILNSLSSRKEIIVSRGEQVEIGGSFRMPEVMKNSGAKMVEIGSTNKTHLHDYQEAISEKTAAIMIVHPSNYKIVGFTEKPEPADILAMAHSHGLPVIFDLGSGAFYDMQKLGFEYEPVVRDVLSMGFDVVSFSGDKLLGGPQMGIIVGRQKYIERIKRNHLLRALRCDKISLALLAATLRQYLYTPSLISSNPTLMLFSRSVKEMQKLSDNLFKLIDKQHHSFLRVVSAEGRAGSGAYPVHPISSLALQINTKHHSAEKLARFLRNQEIPIFGYILDDCYYLNYLTIFEEEIPLLANTLNKIL